jgi:hypothetical protein
MQHYFLHFLSYDSLVSVFLQSPQSNKERIKVFQSIYVVSRYFKMYYLIFEPLLFLDIIFHLMYYVFLSFDLILAFALQSARLVLMPVLTCYLLDCLINNLRFYQLLEAHNQLCALCAWYLFHLLETLVYSPIF